MTAPSAVVRAPLCAAAEVDTAGEVKAVAAETRVNRIAKVFMIKAKRSKIKKLAAVVIAAATTVAALRLGSQTTAEEAEKSASTMRSNTDKRVLHRR